MSSKDSTPANALRHDLISAGLSDLAASIETITTAVAAHWTVPHLWWFTDHTAEHSRRVAGYCDDFYRMRRMDASSELNVLERYILFAAAWTHDIGMQAVSETDSAETTESIRKAHPARAYELLVNGDFSLGISNDVIVNAVANVAMAHGTAYYREVVSSMVAEQKIGDYRVRLPLLAALLLMADELDLHNDRAKLVMPEVNFRPLTAAHWLKHQFVASVAVGVNGQGEIEITIETAQHQNLTDSDAASIVKWIASKLQAQMGLVDAEIRAGFAGHFSFSRKVVIRRMSLGTASRLVSPEALAVIRSENAAADLINYTPLKNLALEQAHKNLPLEIRGRTGPNDSDLDGREDFLSAIVARLEAEGSIVARRWSQLGIVPTSADVLESWAIDLGHELPDAFDEVVETSRRAELLGMLISHANEESASIVFAVSDLDALAESDRTWLIEVAFQQLQGIDNVSLVITTTPALGVPGSKISWHAVDLGEISLEDKARFLSRFLSDHRESIRIAEISDTYLSVKRFADETVILLEP